ncbi:Uncharacterised protein [Mycobacteroides abscessus subsp. abscessus]|nr:Uncharacterised protein [Mycobacteroides abscessus subsp. abscessus]SKU93468.1 Uncharacterised protein [Mycobacteroides abscessus subsp. abscessus]
MNPSATSLSMSDSFMSMRVWPPFTEQMQVAQADSRHT